MVQAFPDQVVPNEFTHVTGREGLLVVEQLHRGPGEDIRHHGELAYVFVGLREVDVSVLLVVRISERGVQCYHRVLHRDQSGRGSLPGDHADGMCTDVLGVLVRGGRSESPRYPGVPGECIVNSTGDERWITVRGKSSASQILRHPHRHGSGHLPAHHRIVYRAGGLVAFGVAGHDGPLS